ncbi:uncharacterized protein LOC107481404 [Arachis duranensis]|uniref:Uncharacterized protein LOC107481404 n=1 Tax=Arachis duranensis TaxID=130453 RepID=A0A6P4CTS0_ARADU|nr:uncharacterized protein LOC107481404 [Arachis duranensis]
MKRIMPDLIGELQSAFVKGRKIHVGTLIACETVQWLKLKKKGLAIIKLDFQKTYDRVKWCFVDTVLEKMSFGRKWRAWVRECVTSASISILVNEEETLRNYKRLLRCFEMMSGLNINFEKSNLILVNCSQEWVNRMCQLLGCQEATLPMPNAVARRIISLQRRFFWGKDDGRPGMALVKGELVQTSEKLGGLGVGDAVFESKSLVVNSDITEEGRLWKDICQVQIREQHVKQKMIDGLAMEVGDERSTRFWDDTWLQWRREPRQWETDTLNQLLNVLQSVRLIADVQDRVVLQEETLDEELLRFRFTKEIWKGLVPFGVELFAWFVLVGRVNTKDRLSVACLDLDVWTDMDYPWYVERAF